MGFFRLLRHKLFRTVKIYKYGVVAYDLNFVPFYFDVLRLAALKRNLPLPYMTIETIEPLRVSISTSQTEPSLAPSFKFIISRSLKSCTLQTIKTPPP